MQRGRFNRSIFLLALVSSGLFHLFVLIPRLLRPLLEKRDAPIEVEYVADVSEPSPAEAADDPAALPTPEHPATTAAKDAPAKAPKETPEKPKSDPALPEPPEVAKVEPPKAPEPPKPPDAPPAPQPELPKNRMKMVDQDRPTDEADNPDAKYLAQKNHRAVEDTRTLETNLIRNVQAPDPQAKPSTESDNKLPNVGDADHKIAELEDKKGDPRLLARSKPLVGDDGAARHAPRPGPLAMRDLLPRAAEPVAEVKPRDGLEVQEEGAGPLPAARVGQDASRAAAASRGGHPRVKLDLDSGDYDRIEGFATADKERQQAARGERSHTPGRWDRLQRQLAVARSSLENFVPEVRVGNQAELGTRAHPFAAYIAEMHRQIHKLWAFGFLSDLEGRSIANPYNDMTLWTQVEIVLKADGALDKVNIVRPSGNAAFDLAAVDTVAASAPFPQPPGAIRSANGKVYLDWRFHRDDRQCGTFGVDPHILTNVAENQDHDLSEVAASSSVHAPRMLKRRSAPAAAPVAAEEPNAGAGPARPAGDATALVAVPDGAKDAAQGWFAAYVRGDAKWLAGWSAAPFRAGGELAAKDGAAVKRMYGQLIEEASRDRRLDRFDVYTAAGVRAALGGLPPGGESDGSMVFAVGKVGKDEFVLLLKKSDQGWRVCGLDR